MEGYYIGQLILVGVLVLITGYYAFQTRRQANLLQRQIEETRSSRVRSEKRDSLQRIDAWAGNVIAELMKIEEATPEGVPDGFGVAASDITNVASEASMFKGNLADTAQQAFNNLGAFVDAINKKADVEKIKSLTLKLVRSLLALKVAVSNETLRQRQLE